MFEGKLTVGGLMTLGQENIEIVISGSNTAHCDKNTWRSSSRKLQQTARFNTESTNIVGIHRDQKDTELGNTGQTKNERKKERERESYAV